MKVFLKYTIFNFLFYKIFTSYCGSFLPRHEASCTQFTNNSHICCYLLGAFDGEYHTMCYPFDLETYVRMPRNVRINGYNYQLFCGNSMGASCGIENPKTYKDCSDYSKKGNSCCFYKYKTVTNCVWLGYGDIGKASYGDLTVICREMKIKLRVFSFFLILLVLF